MALPTTIVTGAAAAFGFVLGTVPRGGRAVFAAALALALALLITVLVVSVALRHRRFAVRLNQPVAKPLKKATLTIHAAPARKTASRRGVPPCA
jgi:hypothetical protein